MQASKAVQDLIDFCNKQWKKAGEDENGFPEVPCHNCPISDLVTSPRIGCAVLVMSNNAKEAQAGRNRSEGVIVW